jgi:hypothetical protein
MQADQLYTLLNAYADALARDGPTQSSVLLKQFCRTLVPLGEAEASKLFRKRRLQCVHDKETPTVGDVAAILADLDSILAPVARREELRKLDRIIRLLRAHESVSIASIESATSLGVASASNRKAAKGAALLIEDLINDYLKRLEAALGDRDAFARIFESLRNDARVERDIAVRIAGRFAGQVSPGASRQKALARILERHQKLMSFKVRSKSVSGKSAA